MLALSTPAVRCLPINDFPGYRVGDDGSAWSCWVKIRLSGHKGWISVQGEEWYQLQPALGRGRARVCLRKNGKKYTRSIARLILEAFVGPCPPGMEACHFPDSTPTNNHLSNLRWDTKKANAQDMETHGTRCKGSLIGDSKLFEEEVLEIVQLFGQGVAKRALGRQFGISHTAIQDILNGKTWSHLTGIKPLMGKLQ